MIDKKITYNVIDFKIVNKVDLIRIWYQFEAEEMMVYVWSSIAKGFLLEDDKTDDFGHPEWRRMVKVSTWG